MSRDTTDDDSSDGFHHVGPVGDLPEGERRLVEIDGREIAVFNLDGSYHAILNFCTHQSGPVCEGMIHGIIDVDEGYELIYTEDEYLSCPWHGWTFEIESGEHTGGTSHRLVKYETTVRDGDVYVVHES